MEKVKEGREVGEKDEVAKKRRENRNDFCVEGERKQRTCTTAHEDQKAWDRIVPVQMMYICLKSTYSVYIEVFSYTTYTKKQKTKKTNYGNSVLFHFGLNVTCNNPAPT